MQHLHPNSTLQGGKYKIEKVLGQGGFGITYLAEQVMLGRKVAVKEFFMKELCDRDESTSHVTLGTEGSRETVNKFRDKFLKEARSIAKLNHSNIVRVIDVFEENGTAYYVMEFAENGSLSDKVKKEGYLSEPVATRYIMQVAEALDYIHQQKMNHLDVKPANIMLNEKDETVLIDFGLSKQYDETGNQTSTTPVGISEGYAPMEQYMKGGVGAFSPETDIYSLGATFYKLLTGITPPNASVVNNEGLSLDELKAKGVSQKAMDVIGKAMESRKKDRMKDVHAFMEGLAAQNEHSEDDNDDTKVDNDDTTLIEKPILIDNNTPDVELYFSEGSHCGAKRYQFIINAGKATFIEQELLGKEKMEGSIDSFQWGEFVKKFNALKLKIGDERREYMSDGSSSTTLVLRKGNEVELVASQEGEDHAGILHGDVHSLVTYMIGMVPEEEEKPNKEQGGEEKAQKTEKSDTYLGKMKKWIWGAVGAVALLAVIGWVNNSSSNKPGTKKGKTEKTVNASFANGVLNVNGVEYEMVQVYASTFTMGATPEMEHPLVDEVPTHQVTLSNNYYMGRTEVTQALWKNVMGNNPSQFKGDNKPVENVSWSNCKTFISKLNSMTGLNFRLPTEAEWEFAARGGTNYNNCQYSGSTNLEEVAWFDGNSGKSTHDVATKQPNELGIYDMSGNVNEWCSDWYGHYSSSSQTDPSGPSSGPIRIFRGGSWFDDARSCRSSHRSGIGPEGNDNTIGFRLALSE